MSSNKIAFIIPYFGQLDKFFPVWMHSCRYNPTIDWILITDQSLDQFSLPSNVLIHSCTFESLQDKIKNKFSFTTVLSTPYDLCEFRVAYGDIFSDLLQDYDFWGYCDMDVLWGNLRNFITDDVLSTNEKISWRGHLTLFRNTQEIRKLYTKNLQGVELYKLAFSNEFLVPVMFDERGINKIFDDSNYSIYLDLPFADLKIRSFNFQVQHFDESLLSTGGIFYWTRGKLFRLFVEDKDVIAEEFVYVHFLKRIIDIHQFNFDDKFFVVPNKILAETNVPDLKGFIEEHCLQKFYLKYYLKRMNISFLLRKRDYQKSLVKFNNAYPDILKEGYPVKISSKVIKRKIIRTIDELEGY
ncbi:DUF6625 family protein [Sediminibacter sp. Hel_I_10]|uniref:DUF6625 family protein n=1 Tax=Sediminibacter sp. Hel_I_10 TaxID=1392490 RepID=UPI00047C7C77|nr:DUF6625 family protein [Sediminibacter sp. Hel_I_10]